MKAVSYTLPQYYKNWAISICI